MAALKSRRVRLIFFLGLAAIAFVAAYVVATSEAKPSNVQMALIILGGLALFEPLRIAWEIITAKDETPAHSNRQILINTVRKNWIQGVLQDALRDSAFEISITSSLGEMVKAVWRRGYTPPSSIPTTPEVLAQTFDNASRKLLILGAPGGGKTVLMLQLAKQLLDEAEADERKSVPVVFNLSSWGVKGGSIKEWLIAELKRNYGANAKYAKELINGDNLIYLLDGLDEVAEGNRNDCVVELNTFITPERQLVVCSRTEEYNQLAEKLSILEAVEAQPLTETQFETYLKAYLKSSETVAKIIATLREDDDVWQEANKPLFINILISTYRDGKPFRPEHIQGNTRQKVQKLLIEPYVVRQLQNVPNASVANDAARRYLAWIGWWLNKQKQTVFYLEGLQAEALRHTRLYLFFRLPVGRGPINVERKLIFKFNRETLLGMLFVGLVAGLFLGLMFGLVSGSARKLLDGLVAGLVFGVISVLRDVLIDQSTIVHRKHPGQGIGDTLQSGLVLGLVGGLVFGLVIELRDGLIVGLIVGLGVGLVDVYKHFLLRGFLHWQRCLPFRAVKFLHYARERRLLRQVGGGFIFIHRYVLDYFDDEYQARYWKKNAGG